MKGPAERRIGKCTNVTTIPVVDSYWFIVADDFEALSRLINQMDPSEVPMTVPTKFCGSGVTTCSQWGFFSAPTAMWHYTRVGGRVVATRKTRGSSDSKSLDAKVIGRFVVGVLAEQDYSCPRDSSENCFPKPEEPDSTVQSPPVMTCESDFAVQCTSSGNRVTVEVLDVTRELVYRIDEIRHLRTWDSQKTSEGALVVELGNCVLQVGSSG
jgi:hypothetical protein